MLNSKKNSKYSTIFFDWSGVVADDNGDDFIRESLKKVGVNNSQVREILEKYFNNFMLGNLSEIEYWTILKNDYKLNIPNQYSGVFDNWQGTTPNQNIIKLVGELKKLGYKVGLITNIIKPVFDIIKSSGYYDVFDDTLASCEVGLKKPQPEIYKLALKRLDVTAQESIFIDDKQSNLGTADKIGFKTILAKDTQQIYSELRSII